VGVTKAALVGVTKAALVATPMLVDTDAAAAGALCPHWSQYPSGA
jgi:hypothetical protein